MPVAFFLPKRKYVYPTLKVLSYSMFLSVVSMLLDYLAYNYEFVPIAMFIISSSVLIGYILYPSPTSAEVVLAFSSIFIVPSFTFTFLLLLQHLGYYSFQEKEFPMESIAMLLSASVLYISYLILKHRWES